MEQGTLVQGRYRLIGLLGRGGMGEVWRAEDEALGRQVAVKCLRAGLVQHDPGQAELQRERFRREARVAAGLQHPGVTVVHDFGDADGAPYLVMELLDGMDLGQVLDGLPGRRMPVSTAVDTARQIASALAYTHARDVIHRDLKPANLIRTTDGSIKICDFGIARLRGGGVGGPTSRLGGGASPVGSPPYMSPEQINSDDLDARSDLYSFGCVLYELLVGAPPFAVGDPLVIMLDHRDTPPRPPRELRPGIPEALERIVLALLAKDPEDRPADAMAVLRSLNAVAAPQPTQAGALPPWARAMGPVPVTLVRVTPEVRGVAELTRRWPRQAAPQQI
ncbi:serine/threonine protein kinase [Streptacidiphilus sp. PB12-B1b]|uniref:serine/threonine-protein kinase n=1 Tax=Streptacidiphilus sp. PB12-B1b TaxID=2705012 RepID=UPI0015FE62F3|nr:serine/threonine protein kinase [Streptacidiphilus sp. PB12-B1b]